MTTADIDQGLNRPVTEIFCSQNYIKISHFSVLPAVLISRVLSVHTYVRFNPSETIGNTNTEVAGKVLTLQKKTNF